MNPKKSEENKENGLVNLLVNIIIPTVVMMKFSKPEYLGEVKGLIVALAFPIVYGIYDLIKRSKVNFISILGLFSILMTGGIGLLKLDRNWMIVKETAIPFIIGLVVLISQRTSYPLVKTFLGQILDLDKVKDAYTEHSSETILEKQLKTSSWLLAFTFFLSALLNFVLATVVLKGEPGTTEFVESLGRMTFLSFPVITIPMMIMMSMVILFSRVTFSSRSRVVRRMVILSMVLAFRDMMYRLIAMLTTKHTLVPRSRVWRSVRFI